MLPMLDNMHASSGLQACSAHTASTWGEAVKEAAAADEGEPVTEEVGWVVVVAATAGRDWVAQVRVVMVVARGAGVCNELHQQT